MELSVGTLNLGCQCLAFQSGTLILSMTVLVLGLKWQNGNTNDSEIIALFNLEHGFNFASFLPVIQLNI